MHIATEDMKHMKKMKQNWIVATTSHDYMGYCRSCNTWPNKIKVFIMNLNLYTQLLKQEEVHEKTRVELL